jgi:hypothetical protein
VGRCFSSERKVWEEFFSVVWGIGFEDAEDGVQQFSCDGHQGL